MATNKPNLNRIWADGAIPSNIIDPDVGEPGKFDSGWVAELPPFEYFNFLQQLFTQGLAHNNEQGINVWDTDTLYPNKAWVKGSDGEIYIAKSEQSGNDPVSSPTKWESLSSLITELIPDPPPPPKVMKRKIFTTSQNFNIPSGVTSIFIDIYAAGGGGGGGDDGIAGGEGEKGSNASNSLITYLTNTVTANGGGGGQNVGLTSTPDIPVPSPGGGSTVGPQVSNQSILVGGGSSGGIPGTGQTLNPFSDSSRQGGSGGNGSPGGLVKCELDTSSGGALTITIGTVGSGGLGEFTNSNNDGNDGIAAFIEIIYFE